MKTNEELLYNKIILNSWSSTIVNFLEFIYAEADKLENDSHKRAILIDKVLKRIFKDLKNKVSIKKIESILSPETKEVEEMYSYYLTVKIIEIYFENDFVIDGKEYAVLDLIFMTIQNDDVPRKNTLFEITSDILNNLLALHYALS